MWDSLIQSLSLSSLDQFHFLRPWWGLLFIPFLLPFLFFYQNQRLDKQWRSIIAPHILEALLIREKTRSLFNPLLLYVCLLVTLVFIAMGPAWVQQPSPFNKDEAGMVIVLDVSDSMLSGDIQPNRLARAKQKIQDLLAMREGSKTALVVYSGSAHSVLPLTDDTSILSNYLESVFPGMMPRVGKFPEKALPLVEQQMSSLPVPGTVLLIADGLGSASAAAFGEYFSVNQHQLLVLGVGDTSSPTSGQEYPELDEKGLKRLARENGGSYIRLSVDDSDVEKIHRRAGNYFVAVDDENVPWQDFGYYLLFVGVLLFLPWFRKGVTLHWGLALCISLAGLSSPQPVYADEIPKAVSVEQMSQEGEESALFLFGQTFVNWWLTPNQQGRWHFNRGEYRKAAQDFEDTLWKGLSFYMAEDFNLAAEYFSRIDSEEGLFNRANALAHGRHYLAAVGLYKYILKQNPDHQAAEQNRALVQELIDAINLMSESQADEPGNLNSSKELGKDDPRTADGAEKQIMQQQELIQFSAEEIWQDEAINEMWMRSVQQNPADFLSSKFYRQLEAGEP